MGIFGTAIGMGLDMAGQKWQNRQQLTQQEKLQGIQMKGAKEMGQFNQGLALDMWDKTNYEAQRRHMEKAGLNVGLMYGMGGGGGATASTPTGNVSGATATGASGNPMGMGLQLGMQMEMQKAQIENIKADTEKKKTEALKTGGVDTEAVMAGIQNLMQTTTNAKLQNGIMQLEKGLKELELRKGQMTEAEYYEQVTALTNKLIGEAKSAQATGEINEATKNQVIEGVGLVNEATKAGIAGTKAGTELTKAKTEESKQTTKNLTQDEIHKTLGNLMRANGIEPGDSVALRMASKWLGESGVTIETITQKSKKLMAWLKGEYGEQTLEHLKEIMKE